MTCALCQRSVQLTFHHLIPRKVHNRTYFKRMYTKDFMKRHGIDICHLCHNGLHRLYDETTLARRLSTLEDILADELVQKHVEWVRKQKGEKRG